MFYKCITKQKRPVSADAVTIISMTADSLQSLPMNKRWLLASRPKTLPAAISPVLVGWAVSLSIHYARTGSVAGFRLLPALLTLLIAVLIQPPV